jgi:hypothetical protein
VQLVIQGSTELIEKGTKEIVIPRKLKARWKRRNLAQARREKTKITPKKRKLAKKKKSSKKTVLTKVAWKQCPTCQGRYKKKHYRCLMKCPKCLKRVREKKLTGHLKRFHD